MAEPLKPCPSCGSDNVEEFIPLPEKYGEFQAVICRACGMRGPASTWNRRVPGSATLALLKKLREYRKADRFADCSTVVLWMTGHEAAAFLAEWSGGAG